MDKEYIIKYYNDTIPYYKLFVNRDSESNALHYGFWDKGTKSYAQAMLNENKFLANLARIKATDKVLDAGCGIGGSSIWLAKNIGTHITGINISDKQLIKARELASRHRVSDKVKFILLDYTNTDFSDDSFDVVWAIESVCHAENKIDFLKEAYRILKRGGRLILADGFLMRDVLKSEDTLYKDFLEGLALPNISQFSEFKKLMEEAGFKNIKSFDKTKDVKKTSAILYRRSLLAYPFAKIGSWLRFMPETVTKNAPAGLAQYKMVNNGLAGYGVFYGEKI